MSSRFSLLLLAVGMFFVAQGALASIASANPCLLSEHGPCSFSGSKFHDLDADGVKDAGEPGLQGWIFYADYDEDGVRDAGEPFGTSDANGNFTISNINCPPATCGSSQLTDIREETQGGWVCSYPAGCKYNEFSFFNNKNPTGKNFGNYQKGSISGVKFEDLDADGQNKEPGEPGIQGIQIYLDSNNNGSHDNGEPTTTTDANGAFSFTHLPPGSYVVREVLTGSYICSFPAAGSSCKYNITLTSGQNATGKNFGNWRPASKSGTKFEDLNGNGQWDKGEPGLEGWTIYVDLDNSGTLDPGEPSAVTDSNGDYTITGIKPSGSQQIVREVQQEGWTCSYPDPCEYSELFQSGDEKSKNNFGNFQRGSISGLKFNDANGNGSQDGGEGGLAGFTFYLDLNNNSTLDPSEPSATSDASGAFSITGVLPGTYTLRETGGPAGYTCTFPAGCSYVVPVTSREQVTGKNFGNKPPENPPVGPSGGSNPVGTAKTSIPSGCASTRFKVKVSGAQITKVTIKVDGKTKKTFTGNGGSSQTFTYKINTKRYKKGAHRLTTTTQFTASSGTPTKTTKLTFQRCGRKSVNPKFTG